MSDNRQERRFEVPADAHVDVRLTAGSLRFVAGPAGAVAVTVEGPEADSFTIEARGGRVVVDQQRGRWTRWPHHEVTVALGETASLRARTASASCEVDTGVRALEIDSASGDVRTADVHGPAKVKTASGDVTLGRVDGDLSVNTVSGRVDVATAARAAQVNTASGDVTLGRVDGRLSVKTVSGDVAVGVYDGDRCSCNTMSGDLDIGLGRGRELDLDLKTLSGDIRNPFAVVSASDGGGGRRGAIQARTVSGDVTLRAVDTAAG